MYFARRMGQGKEVIAGDAKLSPRDIWILWPSSCGQDELGGCHSLLNTLLVHCLDGVLVHKGGIFIQVGHVLLPERHPVPPVEGPNVVLYLLHHVLPIVLSRGNLPTKALGILVGLAKQGSLVHQLLWDATQVVAAGEGLTKSSTATFFPSLAASLLAERPPLP